MRTTEEIIEKIEAIEKRLAVIHKEIDKELQRPFFGRDVPRCRFLDLENKIYTTVLNELKWVLND